MTNKENEFGLTDAEMKRLLNEVSEFDDDIEPMSADEVEEIEASFQAVHIEPEIDERQRRHFEELRQECFEEFSPLPGIIKRALKLRVYLERIERNAKNPEDFLEGVDAIRKYIHELQDRIWELNQAETQLMLKYHEMRERGKQNERD